MIRKVLISFLFLFGFLTFTLLQFNCAQNTNDTKKEMTREELISRGKYLVQFGGCEDCHSPKTFTEMGFAFDSTKTLSGHPANSPLGPIDTSMVQPGRWYLASADLTAWVGPWGISYTANLTPDEPTGIGTWTEEVFIKALRTGKHMGVGRPILPPMPWQTIGKSSDEDLKAVFAYLKSLPPMSNKVPDPVPPNELATKK